MSSFQHVLNDEVSVCYSMSDNEYYLLYNKTKKSKPLICINTLCCDINNLPQQEIDTLFDNDYFIERVTSEYIVYYWFKEKQQ